jgi:hypothetical protein
MRPDRPNLEEIRRQYLVHVFAIEPGLRSPQGFFELRELIVNISIAAGHRDKPIADCTSFTIP